MRFLIFNRITFHMLTISEKNVEKLVIIKNNEKVKVMMTLEPFFIYKPVFHHAAPSSLGSSCSGTRFGLGADPGRAVGLIFHVLLFPETWSFPRAFPTRACASR